MSETVARKRHWFGPNSPTSVGNGHPVLFSTDAAVDFEAFPDGGGYPLGFLSWAYKVLGVEDPARVLHVCSGSVRSGVTVDIRPQTRPRIVADARALPFADKTFTWIMIDPPYSKEYAQNLYGTGAQYPLPSQVIAEAWRVLRPGGRFGLLHFQVPMVKQPMQIMRVYGITTGSGYAIRAFTVIEKTAQMKML